MGAQENWCRCWCCTVSTVSSCNETLMRCFLKSGKGLFDHGSPVWSVSGMLLKFLRLDLAPVKIGFDAVLVALLMSTHVPFAMDKFTIQQSSRDAIFLHGEDKPNPSELGLDEDRFNAGGFSTVLTFQVGDMILPTHSKYRPKGMHVEVFQLLNVHAVQCPKIHIHRWVEGWPPHSTLSASLTGVHCDGWALCSKVSLGLCLFCWFDHQLPCPKCCLVKWYYPGTWSSPLS